MYTHTDIYMDRSSMDISTFGESSQGVLAFSGLRTTDFEISCHFYTVSLSLRNKHCKRTLQNKFFSSVSLYQKINLMNTGLN